MELYLSSPIRLDGVILGFAFRREMPSFLLRRVLVYGSLRFHRAAFTRHLQPRHSVLL
jgi:hypothetical protein